MIPGNDQDLVEVRLLQAEEGHNEIVFVDKMGRRFTRDNATKDAIIHLDLLIRQRRIKNIDDRRLSV
jgi:hypothetical protein